MTTSHTPSLLARIIATAGMVALGIGLAGCTGGDADGKASASATASAAATEKPAITDVKTPAGAEGAYVGAVKDVAVTTCKRDGDKWAVAGTVKNPEAAAQGYRIYVSLLKGLSDTRAVKEVDVARVEKGDTKNWKTSIGTAERGLSCVLRVERFTK